jgi:predicted nucleic acid-binding protein
VQRLWLIVRSPWLGCSTASDAEDGGPAEAIGNRNGTCAYVVFIEITNVLAMVERKSRITRAQSEAFIADLNKLGIERDDEAADRAFTHLFALCRIHRLNSYDATYLDLAIRRSLPLATLDEDLRKTAKKLCVGLLG